MVTKFQSTPPPKGRCNVTRPSSTSTIRCFNPHRPRRGDATVAAHCSGVLSAGVSIHTAPEGAMQPVPLTSLPIRLVSIHTAPEGAMQPLSLRGIVVPMRFNPHRPRRGDATRLTCPPMRWMLFQSTPPPKGRCNMPVQDLPFPPLSFQSTPPPKGRCNAPKFTQKRAI